MTRILTGVVLGLALVLGLTTLLTRTPLCKLWLLPAIGGAMGVRVEARSATVLSSGTIVLEDAVFILPGLKGPAGRFLEIDRLEVDPDFTRHGVPISRMRLDGAVFRVSQATDSELVNLQLWDLPGSGGSGGGGGRTTPPRIDLRSASIEFGEHGPGAGPEGYRVLKQMRVRGSVVPTGDAQGSWAIDLHEADPRDPTRGLAGGIAVGGRIDDAGVHLAMTQASLADWPASAVPSRHRKVFEMLAIEGEITRTFLELPWEGEVAAGIVLRDVSMTLPFERKHDERIDALNRAAIQRGDTPIAATAPAGEGPAGIRMTRSGGTIAFIGSGLRATLDGWIEDLPYSITLDYQGLSSTSPFRCELSTAGFHMSERPGLLPFLPYEVLDRLADFRNPTGLVDAQVVIERGEAVGGVEGPTRFSGKFQVREGRAAFNAFPYPFEQMEADVSFNEDEVRLDRITGVSASGARLAATGLVTPLGDEAEVTVRVTVTGAPVDAAMLESMGPKQGPLIDAIFNQRRFEELVSAGLVISPERRDALLEEREGHQRRLAELSTIAGVQAREEARRVRALVAATDRALRTPAFALGGLADVAVVVHRTGGLVSEWDTHVDVQLARAGILPAHFPVPVEATGLHFVIDGRALTLERGEFHPLSGGTATVSVEALLPGKHEGEGEFEPRVSIAARGVPLDRFVLHAVGHAGDPNHPVAAGEGLGADWLAPMQAAELVGLIDADVSVLRRAAGDLGFDVAARFDALRAVPPEKPGIAGGVLLQARDGRLTVDENSVGFSLGAQVLAADARGAVMRPAGEFEITGRVALRPDGSGVKPFLVTARGQDVLTDVAIERIVGLIAPAGERALADLRSQYAPSGMVGGSVEVHGTLGDPEVQVAVAIADPKSLEVGLAPGRVGLSGGTGWLRVTFPTRAGRSGPAQPGELIADAFESQVTLNGQPQGLVRLSGRATLLGGDDAAHDGATVANGADPPTTRMLATGALDMRLDMERGSLESPLTRAAIEAFVPDRGRDILPLDPAGIFDLALTVRRADESSATAFDGVFRPHTLALTLGGERTVFQDVQGEIQFDARGGLARGVRAVGSGWSVAGDAAWTRAADGQIVLDATLAGDAAGLTGGVRAILPVGLLGALDQIGLKASGPVTLSDGVLHASIPGGGSAGAAGSIRMSGAVRGSQISASVGVPIQDASGTVWFETSTTPGAPAAYSLSVAADTVRAGGLLLNDAKAIVRSGEREGEVLVPLIEAGTYGGRLAGSGRLTRSGRGSGELKYDMALQLSGVRFASLLEDHEREGAGGAGARAAMGAFEQPGIGPGAAGPADASRGLLAAEVSLGGVVGRDQTRRGRGSVQVGGGPVVSLPLLMPVIEVTNLRMPANTPLDVAFGEFYVLGDTVTFEELSAFTRSVEIWGYGTLDWADKRLDMRFNTRSTSPIPVVSELLEGVRNELVSTRVRGTMDEPEIDTIQFQGTRRVLDTLLGDGPGEQARRLTEIGDRARLNRSRALRAGERLRWLVASQMEAEAAPTTPR